MFVRTVILAFICSLSLARAAMACSCTGMIPACHSFWRTDAVFVGNVVSIEDVQAPKTSPPAFLTARRVHLRVYEQFKGTPVAEVDVFTGQDGGSCGYPFVVGTSYLVFADTGADQRLTTGICNRTEPLTAASEDLAYLRALPTMHDTEARIFGRVQFFDPIEGSGLGPQIVNFAGARLTASGPAGHFSAVTGADGLFDIRVPVGKYGLTVEVPAGQYADLWFPATDFTDPTAMKTDLTDPRACTEAGVAVHSDGRMSGRIVDARGQPIGGLSVEAGATPAVDGSFFRPGHTTRTAADGTFAFARVPPGDYEIGLNLSRTNRAVGYPRVLYAAKDEASPSAVRLEPSGRITLGDLVVPASIDVLPMVGTLRRDDGKSAAGAKIYFGDPSNTGAFVGEPVTVDANGGFSFAGIAGYAYRLEIECADTDSTTGTRRYIRSEEIVTAARTSLPLVVTIKVPR